MRRLLLLAAYLLFVFLAKAQFILEEDFDFSGNVSGVNGWVTQSGVSNFMHTTTPSLIFPGYPGSGIGNAVLVDGVAGEDVYKVIPGRTKLYYSFLIRVIPTTNKIKTDFVSFLGKEQNVNSVSSLNGNYFARIIIQTQSDGTWKIGTSNWSVTSTSASPVYSNATFQTNQTYAIVVSLDMADNHRILIWVKENDFPNNQMDAGTPDVEFQGAPNTSALPTSVDVVGLRQSSSSPRVIMDGLRVFDTWAPQILPLRLLSFAATLDENKNVQLKWTTAQSINVRHFELEKSSNGKHFQYTTTILCLNQQPERDYNFLDYNVNIGQVYYRLKIVDLDGSFVYSNVIHIDVNIASTIKIGMLGGKVIKVYYPNPIKNGNIKILDFSGIVRKTIPIGVGEISSQFNLSELSSGNYILKLEDNANSFSQKFFLQ